jgi:hypothetical protein
MKKVLLAAAVVTTFATLSPVFAIPRRRSSGSMPPRRPIRGSWQRHVVVTSSTGRIRRVTRSPARFGAPGGQARKSRDRIGEFP